MRTTWRVSLVALLATAAILCGAGSALAAPKATALAPAAASKPASGTPAPLAQGTVGVQVGPDEAHGKVGVILGLTLANDIKLPARVQVPLPAGATVQWAGEVLGGDPSVDPQRAYTIHDGKGGKYIELTVEQGHLAQIETLASPLKVSGNDISAQIEYVQSVPGLSSEFSVRLPANISNVKIDPKPSAGSDKNSAGETLYSLGIQTMTVGTKLPISVTYTRGGSGSSAVTTASSQTPIIVLVGLALVVVLVALAIALRRRSGSGEGDGDDVDPDDVPYDSDDVWTDDDASASDASANGAAADCTVANGAAADAPTDTSADTASTEHSSSDASSSDSGSSDPFDSGSWD